MHVAILRRGVGISTAEILAAAAAAAAFLTLSMCYMLDSIFYGMRLEVVQ